MDVVLKRAAQRSRVVGRRIAKDAAAVQASKEWYKAEQLKTARRAQLDILKASKRAQKEQWLRGPLAPRLDIGKNEVSYGTMPERLANVPDEYEKRKPEWYHIKEGDRVAVMTGTFKGRIAEVTNLDKDACRVKLKGIRMNIHVPKSFEKFSQGAKVVPAALSIHLNDVKLVYPLPDPTTGLVRDVLVEKVEPIGREWDKHKLKWTDGYRVVYGTKTIIPWPIEIEDKPKTHEIDTTEDLVKAQTFRPSLLVSPMPTKVLDELRHRNSRFRTRYTYEEIQKIERKAGKEAARAVLMETVKTPLKELAELRAKQKAENEKELTDAQLEAIGKVVLQAKAKAEAAVKALKTSA